MTARSVVVLADPGALAAQAALEFETRSHAAIDERGRFAVALSGGRTPKAMLQLLASADFVDDIPWENVHIFWGDERCVSPGDTQSNFGMAKAALLDKVPLPQANVHRMHGEFEPHAGAVEYCEQLRAFFDGPTQFDLTFLGVGPDGHTASLFPHSSALGVTDELCVANFAGEKFETPWRLTLTYPALNASQAILFLVEGAEKADIVARVLEGTEDPALLPAQGIAPAGTLTWMLEAAAAAKLTKR
jgi:6-phosphogluconolactonase